MKEIRDIDSWKRPESGCAMALGRFDGVHRGHRTILERTVEFASEHGLTAVCFSFRGRSHTGSAESLQLTTDKEKAGFMEDIGIDILLHPAFERPLIDTPAKEFIHLFLVDRWRTKFIVAGFDFRFGKDRQGDTGLLLTECKRAGVQVDIVEAIKVEGEVVKATQIRKLIGSGNIEKANRLLGWNYSASSEKIKGHEFGRSIGYPTLNFEWPEIKARPVHGVYAVFIQPESSPQHDVENRERFKGVANFGLRPTIQSENRDAILEVHILETIPDDQLDRSNFRIEFISYIRPERKFDTVEELKEQIGRDCEKANAKLG